jgi:hypothetical protein
MQCPNCRSGIVRKYCAECGQRHKEFVPSLTAFLSEAWDGFLLFDAKVVKTLRGLFFCPGTYMTDFVEGRRGRYISPLPLYLFAFSFSVFLYDVIDPTDVTFCDPMVVEVWGGWLCQKEQSLGPGALEKFDTFLRDYKIGELLLPGLSALIISPLWQSSKHKFVEHLFFIVTWITAVDLMEVFVQLGSLVSPSIKESYESGFAGDFVSFYFPIWFLYRTIREYYGDSIFSTAFKTAFVFLTGWICTILILLFFFASMSFFSRAF